MGLDYESPKPFWPNDGYSARLACLAVWTGLSVVVSVGLLWSPDCPRETAWVLLGYHVACLSGQVMVIVVRDRWPDRRRWPSLMLNVLLLTYVPVGTLVAIYSLFFGDLYTNGERPCGSGAA